MQILFSSVAEVKICSYYCKRLNVRCYFLSGHGA